MESTVHGPVGANLAKGLVLAQKAARAVEKDARNSFHKYKYASSEAIIQEGREALSAGGVALLQTSHRVVMARPEASEYRAYDWRLEVDYLLVHESGETLAITSCVPVVLEKGRPGDKAEAGALTTSLGYVLRGVLLLPRVEEGTEMDTRDDRDDERPQQREPREPREQQPPRTVPTHDEVLAKLRTEALIETSSGTFATYQRLFSDTIARHSRDEVLKKAIVGVWNDVTPDEWKAQAQAERAAKTAKTAEAA